MALIVVRCPACGGELQFDDKQDKLFCMYCGSQVILQNTTQKIKVDYSDTFSNLLELSRIACEACNGEEAFSYANRALEIDAKSPDAWICKMKSFEWMETLPNQRVVETMSCADNAIKYSTPDRAEHIKDEVYTYYFERAIRILQRTTLILNDISRIVSMAAVDKNATNEADEELRHYCQEYTIAAIELKHSIPVDAIKSSMFYQDKTFELAMAFVECEAALDKRISLYSFTKIPTGPRQKILDTVFKLGLPDDRAKEVQFRPISSDANFFPQNGRNSSSARGGCYIATAIYGSYNAPEVMVLRYYRDTVLQKTWYGRLFIRTYYFLSPPFAKWLKNASDINNIVRVWLDALVRKLKNQLNI